MKEMCLRGISNMETANAFHAEYTWTSTTSGLPMIQGIWRMPTACHRPVLHDDDERDLMFNMHYERTLSRSLVVQFDTRTYHIFEQG